MAEIYAHKRGLGSIGFSVKEHCGERHSAVAAVDGEAVHSILVPEGFFVK